MARPVKRRRICELPENREFAPVGVVPTETVTLTIDEFETIRLIDRMGLEQEDCAVQMNVARTTVQAIYNAARGKLAEALVCGKMLRIDGGSYELCEGADTCCARHCPRRARACCDQGSTPCCKRANGDRPTDCPHQQDN